MTTVLRGAPSGAIRLSRALLVHYDDHTINIAGLVGRHPLPPWQSTPAQRQVPQRSPAGGDHPRRRRRRARTGDIRRDGFLVDMARVFEELRGRGALRRPNENRRPLPPTGPPVPRRGQRDHRRPELVWCLDGVAAGVVDANYKVAKPAAGFPMPTLYRVLAYATALGLGLGLGEGHLVYARGNESTRRWRVRPAGIGIPAHTRDLDAPPIDVLAQVADLARRIAACTVLTS